LLRFWQYVKYGYCATIRVAPKHIDPVKLWLGPEGRTAAIHRAATTLTRS
jgi:hypothetical protein